MEKKEIENEERKMADGAKINNGELAPDKASLFQMPVDATGAKQVSTSAKKRKRRKVALPKIAE